MLLTAAAALAIATLIAASSAHALLLGDALVRSAPGAPLRAVIPLKPTLGETLEDACFRLVPAAGGLPGAVTAKVSLERTAATPRLIVTTQEPMTGPVVRFAIEAGCDGSIRRNYVLVLDGRSVAAARPTTIAMAASAREPGQERRETAPTAATRAAEASLPEGARAALSATSKSTQAAADSGTHAAAGATLLGRLGAALLQRPVDAEDTERLTWYLGAPLGMGAIALAVLWLTRRRSEPELPDWTRGGEYTGPRSYTDMSAQPVTLSHGDLPPLPRIVRPRSDGAALQVRSPGIAANSLRRAPANDLSTLDTLIDDASEADLREERAVREAWAAARGGGEREEDNAILRAIDAAEREMLYVPASQAEAAMDRTLEDDLTRPRRPKKAAA